MSQHIRSNDEYSWDDLSGKLRGLLIEHEKLLSPEEVVTIEEFIDVGEYGLAFETLCTQLDEHHVQILEKDLARFSDLGVHFNLDLNYWQSLKSF